ncbi:MAG: NAD(P)H-dependent oxidoreductase [Bacteriovoracaceae bacterium]|nr:NAD(P)H-dependent oxidoreductase [Bacteriovoracaceae bacterium]
MNSKITEQLRWRYATKMFDPSKKLNNEQLGTIFEATRLTPSSFGLSPWKLLIVEDPVIRKRLRPASWNQSQIVDASHLLILCTPEQFSPEHLDHFINTSAEQRAVEVSSLAGYKELIEGFIGRMNPGQQLEWMRKQAYIALGNLLSVTAMMGVDSCPMEGFDREQYNQILSLPSRGLDATVVCAIGHRSSEDKYSELKKVRFPLEEVVIKV